MITEEQLKKVLDSLRLNAYDTPVYKTDSWCDKRDDKEMSVSIRIESIENKNCLAIYLYKYNSKWLFGREWFRKRKKPLAVVDRFTIGGNGTTDRIEISNELYDNFSTFIKECNRKEQFIAETNVDREFNL